MIVLMMAALIRQSASSALCGWSAIVSQVALTCTVTIIVALAAQQAGRPDLIRSPKRVLAHTWEGY